MNQKLESGFHIPGIPATPRMVNPEILDAQFSRENLTFAVMKALDTAATDPVDKEYLERQLRTWNNMEESGRGFKGHPREFYQERTKGGTLRILYFPESDSVQLEWKENLFSLKNL